MTANEMLAAGVIDHDEFLVLRERALRAAGYDYAETQLTAEELLRADAGRVKQYERGIITGGELDCLTRTGRLPG